MTAMSQKPQSDDAAGGVRRSMTDAELDALSRRLRLGANGQEIEAADAITTLRAQLAAETARADRAEFNAAQLTVMVGDDAVEQIEAAVAAQIEVDAGICDEMHRSIWEYDAYECALSIRAQPHDRTALDRMLANADANALRRAALVCAEYPVPIGCTKAAIELQSAILALIEREGV